MPKVGGHGRYSIDGGGGSAGETAVGEQSVGEVG